MKTLIIHPKDSSTSFLDIVYTPIVDKTVITGGVSKSEVKQLIMSHDRVMMMGHGSPMGLFSMGNFENNPTAPPPKIIKSGNYYYPQQRWDTFYIIDNSMVDVLRDKMDNVFIWCNADMFVERHGLTGFYSGMFISEVGEANYCGVKHTTQEQVDESNMGFCHILAKYINEGVDVIHEKVKREYGAIADINPVAHYNEKRLYLM